MYEIDFPDLLNQDHFKEKLLFVTPFKLFENMRALLFEVRIKEKANKC